MNENKGFTLVELSIVIVIIGLIVSGIVGAQSLVRQAKVRSVITEYKTYKLAANAFKLEYDGLPGDFINASAYGLGTSGDGSNLILGSSTEVYYAWQHLGNAELVQGQYSGADAGSPNYQIGVNLPPSGFGPNVTAVFSSIDLASTNCIATFSSPLYGLHSLINVIAVGSNDVDSSGCPRYGFLRVSEAHGIDAKIDDGLPDSGIMFSANDYNTNVNGDRCVDNNTEGTGGANYDFDETGESCRLIFRLGL